MDADGHHQINDIKSLFDRIIMSEANIVVGRRVKTAFSFRKIGNYIISVFTRCLLPNIQITDITSGMKMCETNLIKRNL